MKRKLTRLGVLLTAIALPLAFVLPVSAQFATLGTDSPNRYVTLEEGTTAYSDDVAGDLLIAGDQLVISGEVGDNLLAAAGAVQVDGVVNGDAMIAAGYVVINGDVLGDLRIAAGEVYINGTVSGDLVIFAGRYSISSESFVGGQEILSAGHGVRGTTDNPVDLTNASHFSGGFSSFEFSDEDLGALVGAFLGASFVVSLILKLIMLIGSIIAAYVVLRLFPVFSENTLTAMKNDGWKSVLLGFVTLIVAPVLLLVLLLTIFGLHTAIVLGIIGLLAWYLTGVYANYFVGRHLLVKFGRPNTGRALPLVVGFVVVEGVILLLGLIPLLGGIIIFFINLLLVSWTLGAMVVNKKRALMGVRTTGKTKKRKKNK
ncbi:MAG: hypothetical protein ACE5DX_01215 [Candidatus Dojkabacteria bacterium]